MKSEDISARAEEMKMIIISELEDSINYQEELFKDDININFDYKSFAKGKGVLLSVNFAKLVVNLLKAAQSQSVEESKLIDKLKMSQSKKGIPHSEEHRKRTSEAMKGVNSKRVINTVSGFVYNSVNEAAKSVGIDRTTLIKKLKGKAKNNTDLKYAD